jgi:TPR repeat protein
MRVEPAAIFLWAGLFVSLCFVPAIAQEGQAAYERGDYKTALEIWLEVAEEDDAQAQFNLGAMYEHGRGVRQDYAEALKWFRRAAENGKPIALHNVGFYYEWGRVVDQDYQMAMKWYRRAAEKGHPRAFNYIGDLYRNGHGVAQNHRKANEWQGKAAERGDADAQIKLGQAYLEGLGTEKNVLEAVRLFRLAAEQGEVVAQNSLAWQLAIDKRVRDGKTAIKFARRAVAQEDISGYSDTLAASYAAAGRFKKAVREQRYAIKKAKAEGEEGKTIEDYRKRLSLYRQGKMLTCPGGPCD